MSQVRPLSSELAKKAKDEFNETPEYMEESIKAVREWLKKSPHIKARTDDQFLVAFLRGCKYRLEKVKEKMDLFYSIRNALPEIFSNRNPNDKKVREIIKLGVVIPLPKTETPDSPRITLIRPGCYDSDKYSVMDTYIVSTMMFEIMMREDDNLMVAGQIVILDLADVSLSLFLQMNPATIKKMTVIDQDAGPVREKGTHFIHTPSAFYQVFNIFKVFMTEKSKQRVNVHGDDMESLFSQVPKKLFPTEYGGEAGSIQSIIDDWEKKIDSYTDFFEEERKERYGTDEKKRIGKPKNADELFGLEGSFRQLQID